MAKHKLVANATLVTGGWQAYIGPGVLEYAFMDGTALSSNVLTLYDAADAATKSADLTLSTWTQDTDFGVTVPNPVFRDGAVVATLGTTSANTKFGVPFADGLFVNKTGDTTHNASLKFLIRPLIRKSVNIGGTGSAAGSINIFDGPGVVVGIRIRTDQVEQQAATLDLLFKDSNVSTPTATGSGNTLITATDHVTAGPIMRYPVSTTGVDDVGAAVTTAATGAYPNPGVAFFTGLNVSWGQANTTVGNRSATIDVLIDP